MEIKQYYIASYAKASLEEEEPSEYDEDYVSSIFENVEFYEKRIYLAHIKDSTREKYQPEELVLLAKESESDETPNNHITLDEGEWIENVNESSVVCTNPDTYEEEDGIQYLSLVYGLQYFLAETDSMEYAVWQ